MIIVFFKHLYNRSTRWLIENLIIGIKCHVDAYDVDLNFFTSYFNDDDIQQKFYVLN